MDNKWGLYLIINIRNINTIFLITNSKICRIRFYMLCHINFGMNISNMEDLMWVKQ